MKKRKLGTSDLSVTEICLGTMNWGEQNSEKEAHEQMDYAVAHDVNFFDTAETYPVPPREESHHRTETYIGNWLKKTGKRKDLIIATKVAGPGNNTYLRPDRKPLKFDKKNIKYALEGSLKRLQTEYVDLYQLHWPERKTNYFQTRHYTHDPDDSSTPIEETLEVLQELIKEGKVRYAGVSNENPWGLNEFLRLAREKGLPRIVSTQNPYSLIMRQIDFGLSEILMKEHVSLLVYSPLSMGVLTGKYLGGKVPKGSRFDYSDRNHPRYNPPNAQPGIKAYVELARKYNMDPAQLAIAFTLSRPYVASSIIGATSVEQLKTDIGAADLVLTSELLKEIEEIYKQYPDPIG